MILADILSLFLRLGELVSSVIVLGLTSSWLHRNHGRAFVSRKRFIYTEIIAVISLLFSLIFLLPFLGTFIHWPMDLLLFAANMIAFGLLANYIHRSCHSVWDSNDPSRGRGCGKYRSELVFLFLASIFFLASALLGMHIMRKRRQNTVVDKQTGNNRSRWLRSRY